MTTAILDCEAMMLKKHINVHKKKKYSQMVTYICVLKWRLLC